jgi:predicted molibdopterin-dependent oxidoreductase YjgC
LKAITVTIDDREVSGRPGTTILELAQEMGIKIPTLCHHPQLTPFGACRICLVEEENRGALLASCVTVIAPGMVINTYSPKVLEARRVIIKLMLASHPESCLVCEKGNRCQLRQIAADLGIGVLDYYKIPHYWDIEEVNPFIVRDLSKCILCGRCIRADHELVVQGAIDYQGRGFNSLPATLFDGPLESSTECTFCGTCVTVCPTGALQEKGRRTLTTPKRRVATVCPYCPDGCALWLEVSDGEVVRVNPRVEGSASGVTICVRGHYGLDFIQGRGRLTHPLIRDGEELREVSWEEALGYVAQSLLKIKGDQGGEAIGVLASGGLTNEEYYTIQRWARTVLKTNNIDTSTRLSTAPSQMALRDALGYGAMTSPIRDLEESGVMMVIGADPTISHPLIGYAIKRGVTHKGGKLIMIDSLDSDLKRFSHLLLSPRKGTELILLYGMIHQLIEQGRWDQRFVKKIEDFEGLCTYVQELSPDKVEELTGISPDLLMDVISLFDPGKRVGIIFGKGVTQAKNPYYLVAALVNLALVTGSIGREGGGIYPILGEANFQGAWDMGFVPELLPGHLDIDDAPVREEFERNWGEAIPIERGHTALEMIEAAKEKRIRGMVIFEEDPLTAFPAQEMVEKALRTLDFLVVSDLWPSPTTKLAHVVFPAASFAEKEGSFTSVERRVQRIQRGINPPGKALPAGAICSRLSEAMGFPLSLATPEEIAQSVPLYRGVVEGGGFWGGRNLYASGFPKKKARFIIPDMPLIREGREDEYPFYLNVGALLVHQGCGRDSIHSPRLAQMGGEGYVEMNLHDAETMDLCNGDEVFIRSSHGELRREVRIRADLPAGELFLPWALNERGWGRLFPLAIDPITKASPSKGCWVKLEEVKDVAG